MGKHMFKLSDMMPNAWFYKLRDMTTTTSKPKTRNSNPAAAAAASRKSFYYSTESRLTRSPSISPMNNPKSTPKKRKTIYMPSPNHRSIPPHSPSEESSIFQDESSDTDRDPPSSFRSCKKFDMVSEQDLNLPPILTRPAKKTGSSRKSVSRARGVKVKNRGKQGTRKTEEEKQRKKQGKRKTEEEKQGLFCSVVVKSSVDPERDFRESMMEMIAENNITASEDLEDLLACYLSLNSDKYHALIIKAFERIWFNVKYY